MGRAEAARAVDWANGQNPISIIVLCRRVIGAAGSLTGYSGGLPAKRWSLVHEAEHARLILLYGEIMDRDSRQLARADTIVRMASADPLEPRKRILVTGGAGFIGSHLSGRLLDVGHDVLVVDNYYSGTRDNVAHLIEHPRFEMMRHDVTFPLYIEVDQIYHLACPASPIFYQRDPVQTTKTSVHGSINMLGLAKRTHARILLASTSEVYGDPHVHPQPESYWGHVNPIGSRSCYDEGKRCAETLFFDYRRQHGMPIKVARIFNTYGPTMRPDDGRVISTFIVQALRQQPLTVFGDGTQSRSFCYVDDMVDALVRLMNAPPDVTGPINLGNPEEFTMLELAEKVIELVGGGSIEHRPLPPDDPVQRRPDIAQAKTLLGWKPTVDLDDGLARTVGYFRDLLDARSTTRCH
jgi:UDP-glucuronate decarboxylase